MKIRQYNKRSKETFMTTSGQINPSSSYFSVLKEGTKSK